MMVERRCLQNESAHRPVNNAENLRDDKGRASSAEFLQSALNLSFRSGIHAACSLVQQDDLRVFNDSTSNSQSLELSARELDSSFSHNSFVTIGERHDLIM